MITISRGFAHKKSIKHGNMEIICNVSRIMHTIPGFWVSFFKIFHTDTVVLCLYDMLLDFQEERR